jgi:hypothetical protein
MLEALILFWLLSIWFRTVRTYSHLQQAVRAVGFLVFEGEVSLKNQLTLHFAGKYVGQIGMFVRSDAQPWLQDS